MAVYTVRADEKQENDVNALKEHYSEKAATKALLTAARDVPKLTKEIAALKAKIVRQESLLTHYQEAGNSITNALECFKMYDANLKRKTTTNLGQKELNI